MPLYEFDCDACGARFEELVPPGARRPARPAATSASRACSRAIAEAGPGVGLKGGAARESDARRSEREAAKKERFVADRKRKRGQGPPGG